MMTERQTRRWSDPMAEAVAAIAAISLIALVFVQGWQVFARYVLNHSPSWIEPVTVSLLTAAMAFGAAAGVHAERHFAFALLAGKAAPRVRTALRLAQKTVVAAIGATVFLWSLRLFLDGIDVHAAGAPLPETLPFAPVAVGGVLMAVFALDQGVRLVRQHRAGEEVR